MNNTSSKPKALFSFKCIPPAFIKLVICVGILAFIIIPPVIMYIMLHAPSLKIPAITIGILLGGGLFALKEKWRCTYQLTITPVSLILQINGKLSTIEISRNQIERFSLSTFIDASRHEINKLSLTTTSSGKAFSIKIPGQTPEIWQFLDTWQKTHPTRMEIIYKNGILHAIERIGETLGKFDKSTDIARIDFINLMH